MTRHIQIEPNAQLLFENFARAFLDRIDEARLRRATFSFALAGGSTPLGLYDLLTSSYRAELKAAPVHFFWGDERHVPPDSEESNQYHAHARLLRPLEIPDTRIHPIPFVPAGPEKSAHRYEETLRHYFGERQYPRFDAILLGLGKDGHTASLFPDDPVLASTEWVGHSRAPSPPQDRVTLTLPVLNASRHIDFLVTGRDKAEMVAEVLNAGTDSEIPAAMVRPGPESRLTFWLDAEAASRL